MIGDVPVRNMIVTSSFSYAYVTAAPLHFLWEGEGGVNSLQGTPSFFLQALRAEDEPVCSQHIVSRRRSGSFGTRHHNLGFISA